MNQVYTVSQINGYLKQLLDGDVQLKSIFVRGEVSNFVHHMKSGHFYFTLKDGKSALKCVMFQWNARHLRFLPGNGMSVIVFGSVQLYDLSLIHIYGDTAVGVFGTPSCREKAGNSGDPPPAGPAGGADNSGRNPLPFAGGTTLRL